jgi:hypothetical protein
MATLLGRIGSTLNQDHFQSRLLRRLAWVAHRASQPSFLLLKRNRMLAEGSRTSTSRRVPVPTLSGPRVLAESAGCNDNSLLEGLGFDVDAVSNAPKRLECPPCRTSLPPAREKLLASLHIPTRNTVSQTTCCQWFVGLKAPAPSRTLCPDQTLPRSSPR